MAKTKTTDPVTEEQIADRGYGLDPERGVFLTSNGEELPLLTVHLFIVERYEAELAKTKPKIPIIETDHGKDRPKGKEANPNDPLYKEAVEDWQRTAGVMMMQFMINVGVDREPPKEDTRYLKALTPYFEEHTPEMRKYFWVLSLISGDTEATALLEAISGNAMATQGGMKEAGESFRGNGQ